MDLTVAEVLCAAGLITASITDLRKQKIYNWITFPMVAIGFAVHTSIGEGVLFALMGLAAATLVHVGLWMAQVERAGDAKLAMGIGALMGWSFMLESTLWTLMLLIPIGLIFLAIRGNLGNLVKVGHHMVAKAQGVTSETPPPLTLMAFGPTMAIAALIARLTEWLHLW